MAQADTKRLRWMLPVLLVLGAGLFLTGISWGLPSRSADPFLFGNRTPWTGAQILALAPDWGEDANRAADVAAHPLGDRYKPIVLNQTDSQRAAIVRRYRLYSDQPDEMITLRALAQMKPGKLQFDPKLYQYGGLWIYPIGVLFKLASLFHLVRVTADLTFYLDHPEAFGRLYVVMRLYSAAWGLVGVGVMYGLARRISASEIIGATAALCYMLLPTVINGAHEAKPHLAGAVLGLIAVDMALRAIETGEPRWVIATGVACGAAASMVLSGWLVVVILPVMGFCMWWHGRPAHVFFRGAKIMGGPPMAHFLALLVASTVALAVYAICNPYVILHLLGNHALLQSNIENSAAMYQAPASIDGLLRGLLLLFEGGSVLVFIGILAIAFFAWRGSPAAWLLLGAAVPGLCVFLMHATGKPGEYGRFALQLDLFCVVGVAMAMCISRHPGEQLIYGLVFLILLLPFGMSYVLAYARETFEGSTRLIAAAHLAGLNGRTLAVDAEPAPYCLPPANLFLWKIVLLPPMASMPGDADVRIDPIDEVARDGPKEQYLIRPILLPTPISWAGKPFRIETRTDDVSAAKGRR